MGIFKIEGELMLQSVRKYTQGWVATIMGIILSLAFVFWGIENYLSGNSKKNVIAKVNGMEISNAELNADFQRAIMRLKEQTGANFSLPPFMQQELKSQALNNLIMQRVLELAAIKSGFKVTPFETSQMIKQMSFFQENGVFSKNRFEQMISRMGYSQQEFFADISKTILLNQGASGIIGSSFVLPNELETAIALTEQKRDFEYALISAANFKKQIEVTPEEIKVFYSTHRDKFTLPAKLKIDYVQLSVDDLKKDIKLTNQEVDEFFNSNSELNRNNPEALARAKATLIQQKAEQAFLALSDKLTDSAFTSPNSLDPAASILSTTVQHSDYFTQEEGGSAITKNPKVIAAAFNSDLIKQNTNSNLIELAPGNVVVIRVQDYQPVSVASLETVQDKIKHSLIELKSAALAEKKGRELFDKIKNEMDFKRVVEKDQLAIIAKQDVNRHDKTINSDVLKVAFSIPPNTSKPIAGLQLANGDCAIVHLKKSTDFDASKMTQDQKSQMMKLYSETYGKVEYNLYVEDQMTKAKIRKFDKAN